MLKNGIKAFHPDSPALIKILKNEIHLIKNNNPNIDTPIIKYRDDIPKISELDFLLLPDAFKTDFDFFLESSNLSENYKKKYTTRLILQDNNSIISFAILGFIIGLIITFIMSRLSKK